MAHTAPASPSRWDVDFNVAPLLLIWETTRACALACLHCRAEARDLRDPRELTRDEGKALLDETRAMGTPLVILTGGDPLQRDDLEDLIAHAKGLDLRVGAIPAATPRLTRDRVVALKAAGLDQMAMSLDGPDAASHDAFRGVEGSYAKVEEGAAWAHEADLPFQLNTVFGAWNLDAFDALAAKVRELGVVFWEVFFLVPTGRGTGLQGCTAVEAEALFGKLHRFSRDAGFVIKVTEAPHYRRYLAQQGGAAGTGHPGGGRGLTATRQGVNAGKGFCFVDHVGKIYPSGFLPMVAGDVREDSLTRVYRESPVFTGLRDLERLGGRCGRCVYRDLCGGSRSRAYALTGDPYAEDPMCVYEP